MERKFEAVIFDLDGSLVDSLWVWDKIDIDYLEKHSYQVPEDLNKIIEGMSFTEVAQYFKDRFSIEDDIEDIKAEWIEMAQKAYSEDVKLREGAEKFLEYIKSEKYRIGLGSSNTRSLIDATLDGNGISQYFESIRTSCEVSAGKPSPDIFLKVASDLDIPESKCIVIEDTFAGVQAAKRANMTVIGIYDEMSAPWKEDIMELSDHYAYNYSDVMEILKNYQGK